MVCCNVYPSLPQMTSIKSMNEHFRDSLDSLPGYLRKIMRKLENQYEIVEISQDDPVRFYENSYSGDECGATGIIVREGKIIIKYRNEYGDYAWPIYPSELELKQTT